MDSNFELRPSGVVLVWRIILVEIIAALLYLMVIVVNFWSPGAIVNLENRASFEVSFFVAMLAVRAVIIGVAFLQWQSTKYTFTSQELVIKGGVFSQQDKRYNLEHLESLSCSRGMMGVVLGFGTICLKLRLNDQVIQLPYIQNPTAVIDQLTALRNEALTSQTYTQTPTPESTRQEAPTDLRRPAYPQIS